MGTTWYVLAVICFIMELVQPGIYIMFFGTGALFTGFLSYFFENPIFQTLIFAFLSCLSAVLLRPLLYKRNGSGFKSCTERLIGMNAVVTVRIPRGMHGFVKIGSELWMATASEEIDKGEIVKITYVSGATLTVEKVKDDETGKKEL